MNDTNNFLTCCMYIANINVDMVFTLSIIDKNKNFQQTNNTYRIQNI
jgi:hypothetical protein